MGGWGRDGQLLPDLFQLLILRADYLACSLFRIQVSGAAGSTQGGRLGSRRDFLKVGRPGFTDPSELFQVQGFNKGNEIFEPLYVLTIQLYGEPICHQE